MKMKAVFLAGVLIGGLVNALLVATWPNINADAAIVTQCSQPPEVENMVRLMASMPLKILETGTRPTANRPQHRDEIADLIRGLK